MKAIAATSSSLKGVEVGIVEEVDGWAEMKTSTAVDQLEAASYSRRRLESDRRRRRRGLPETRHVDSRIEDVFARLHQPFFRWGPLTTSAASL